MTIKPTSMQKQRDTAMERCRHSAPYFDSATFIYAWRAALHFAQENGYIEPVSKCATKLRTLNPVRPELSRDIPCCLLDGHTGYHQFVGLSGTKFAIVDEG
jgi:hypothetical protein